MKDLTYEDYRKNPELEREYFLQIAQELEVEVKEDFVERMMRGEYIPRHEWDFWAAEVRSRKIDLVHEVFRRRGEYVTLGKIEKALKVLVEEEVKKRRQQ